MLVFFFYDILIYSKTWDEHLGHLYRVFEILQHNQLFLKNSKWSFGWSKVEYLGHIISKGVSANPSKLQVIQD